MLDVSKMPNGDELAELSNTELDRRIREAFLTLVEAKKSDTDASELDQIYRALHNELLTRLHHALAELNRK